MGKKPPPTPSSRRPAAPSPHSAAPSSHSQEKSSTAKEKSGDSGTFPKAASPTGAPRLARSLRKHAGLEEDTKPRYVSNPKLEAIGTALGLDTESVRDVPSESIRFAGQANHRVFCHQNDFLLFEENDLSIVASDTSFSRRANLVLQHLAAHGRTGVVKGVRGNDNQGWRRTPFGGNRGSHFYAWWAPADAAPVAGLGFPSGSVVVRAVRHHDDHRPLTAGLPGEYDEITPGKLVAAGSSEIPLPWTATQLSFSRGDDPFRVLIGYPGTGKTTALWNAVITRAAQKSLYITWSPRLTELAGEYFTTFGPTDGEVVCRTFEQLVDAIIGRRNAALVNRTVKAERAAFDAAIADIPVRELGSWAQHTESLFGEIRAHLVGASLPHEPHNLIEATRCRLSNEAYLARRRSELGSEAARDVLRVADLLDRKGKIEDLFPELERAFRAGLRLHYEGQRLAKSRAANYGQSPEGSSLRLYQLEDSRFDRIVVDETQDLTPAEAAVPLLLARALAESNHGRPPVVLAAGDEGQTVRPTDFEWGWFKDMVTGVLAAPGETKLAQSLRFPRRIAELVNRASELYGTIAKSDRPRDMREAEASDNISETIILCRAGADDPDTARLLAAAASRPGTAIVGLEGASAASVPTDLRDAVLTPAEAKGCEYQTVVLLDPSASLDAMISLGAAAKHTLRRLWLRSAIDRFRVGLSRATETLVLLDTSAHGTPGSRELDRLLAGLGSLSLSPAEAHDHLVALEIALDERVQQSLAEALELLALNPALSLRRARNAVGLLGDPSQPGAITEPALRREACAAMVRIAWTLASRPSELPPGTTPSELLLEAIDHCQEAGLESHVPVLRAAHDLSFPVGINRCDAARRILLELGRLPTGSAWFGDGISALAQEVVSALESGVRDHPMAELVAREAPTLFQHLNKHVPEAVADADSETERFRGLAVKSLVRAKLHRPAMEILGLMKDPSLLELAMCEEEAGLFYDAASHFEEAGKPGDAMRCWRRAQEFGKAAAIADSLGNRDLQKRLEWLQRIRRAADDRPANLMSEVEEHEKAWLREVLAKLSR